MESPFFLAGGIRPEDASELRTLEHKAFVGIDLNSRFELEAGRKDADRLYSFIRQVKN